MLWDPERQDRELLEYYRNLIKIRKSYSCLTEGEPMGQWSDDDTGTVIIDRGELVLVFHSSNCEVSLPQYAQWKDLISDTTFTGMISGCQAMVIAK
jgi:hypothetical protein